MDYSKMNTTALAYIGDSVYEVFIRKHVMASGQTNADMLHRMAVKFVRAEGQALALKKIFDSLTEEEAALARRARNRKTTSKPKNADPISYKLATAFEALLGYLFLSEQQDRLQELVEESIRIIENAEIKTARR